MQFTKLFSSILDSTIWQEPAETRLVWITLLAMADRQGEVHASIPGLAKRSGVTLEQCELALECLLSPDPYSRTADFEGRRIQRIDGGWELLNHAKYRALLSAEERREYNRRKQAEYRAKKKANPEGVSMTVNDKSITVNHSEQNAHSTEAEAEAEATKKTIQKKADWNPSETMLRLGSLFKRRPSTKWSDRELAAFRKLEIDESDLKLVERFHADPSAFHRTGLQALLNNWLEEVDRARNHFGPSKPSNQSTQTRL